MAELSRWDRFWIGVLGAHPRLARLHPVDVPALRTFGYQLFALWLLFFVIQGIALSVMTQSLPFGLALAALSSTILILAERIFVNGDWFNEGHYWTLHEVDPNDPELGRIHRRRLVYVITRLAVGIAISISVVSIAEPGLFGFEQNDYARKDALRLAPDANAAHRICTRRVADTISGLMRDQERCRSGAVMGVTSGPKLNRLSDVNKRIDALEARKRDFLEKYGAECGGLPYNSSNPNIQATGDVGCQDVANAWKQQADAVETELRPYRAEKSSLEEEIRTEERQLGSLTRDRIAQCPPIATELKVAREREQSDLQQCDKRLKADGGAPEDRKGGLMRTIQYHLRMMADSKKELRGQGADPNGVWWYLLWFKLFVVFLECALFLSKVLGQVRGYSKAVYREQSGGGQGAAI